MKHTALFLLLALASLFQACDNRPATSQVFETKDLVFKGPESLDPGPNTFQAEIPLKLDEFAKANKMDLAAIDNVTLKSASIRLGDGSKLDDFGQFSFQFTGANTEMLTAGIIAKVEKGKDNLNAEIVKDVNLRPLFKGNSIICVIDADLLDAPEDGKTYQIKADLAFEITAKVNQ